VASTARVRQSEAEWGKLIRAFERSSATQAEFCTSRGVNVGTFRYHLYGARGRVAGSARGDEARLLRVELPPVSGGVEIAVAEVVVRVVSGTDVEYVASLVQALRSRGC